MNYLSLIAMISLMLLLEKGYDDQKRALIGSIMTFILIASFGLNVLALILTLLIVIIQIIAKVCCRRDISTPANDKKPVKVEPSSGKLGLTR